MSEASYFPPLSKEEEAGLHVLSETEQTFLADIFKHPTFLKALRRANLAKPTTVAPARDHGDIRQLAKIRGWEMFEKALLASHKKDDILAMQKAEPVEEEYEPIPD